MENTVNERFVNLIEALGKNSTSFCKAMGYKGSTIIHSIVNGRKGNPGFDLLHRIALTFTNVNMDWLITGRGEMFIKNNSYPMVEGSAMQVQEPSIDMINPQKIKSIKVKPVNPIEGPVKVTITDPIIIEAMTNMLTLQKKELEYYRRKEAENENEKNKAG